MDDPSATSTGTVEAPEGVDPADVDRYRPPRSYPYLSAVENRRRRKRAGLTWLAIGVVGVVVVGTVLLLTHTPSTAGQAVPDPTAATTPRAPRAATSTSSSTSRAPTTGAVVIAEPAPTTVPPAPTTTITVSPDAVVCNEGTAETATVLSWTSTDAESAVVGGPAGQISTLVQGDREVAPSRPCSEAPFDDVYTVSVGNRTGSDSGEATVTWTATTGAD